MAKMIIALRPDKVTGKQNIIVKLESDADALPHEHEQLHKLLVEKLLGAGLKLEDLGHIEIEREKPVEVVKQPVKDAEDENTPVANKR